MIEEDFGLETDFDEIGDHVHVVSSVSPTVHAQGHEKVLCWSGQLERNRIQNNSVTSSSALLH